MIKTAIVILVLLSSCASNEKHIVLDYADFGPQVLSYETLGYSWYEWNSHGSKVRDNVKVVIYKNSEVLSSSKYKDSQNAPAVDYRFISYENALEYLNRNIRDLSQTNEFPDLLKRLESTKNTIEKK